MPYFFDTYAFIAYYFERNDSYATYFKNLQGKDTTSILSLMEVYSRVFHAEGVDLAEEITSDIVHNFDIKYLTDIETITDAARFHSKMLKEKRSLSYTDCVNYTLAQKLNLKLLTGDEDFRGVKGVEFVK
jgi:predicted nucleic acid-binding protein